MSRVCLQEMVDAIRFDGLPKPYRRYWFDDVREFLTSVLAPNESKRRCGDTGP